MQKKRGLTQSKAVVLFSGGLDSTALLGYVKSMGELALPISVDYGQRHSKELTAAADICAHLQLSHRVVRLNHLRNILGGSALTDDTIPVPDGHYEAESMKSTVVPNRNMIFIAVAVGFAVAQEADKVFIAAHSGDHHVYHDCRPEFLTAQADAVRMATGGKVGLFKPFVNLTKGDVCRIGLDTNMPLEMSWSCYKGLDLHCGVCGTCVERKEAFAQANFVDPTGYNE